MTEAFRIFASSWPIAFMVVGLALVFLFRRIVRWREKCDDHDYAIKAENARSVPAVRSKSDDY